MTIQGTGLGSLPIPPGRYSQEETAQTRSIVERNFRQLSARLRASVIAADADETITGQWTFDQTIIGDISGDADTVDGEHASAFADAGHTHPAGDIVSGTFADARIAQSNVTQHEGAIHHGALSGLGDDDHPQYANLSQTEEFTAGLHITGGNVGIGTTSPGSIGTLNGLEIAGPNRQLRLLDTDDGDFFQFSASGDVLALRYNEDVTGTKNIVRFDGLTGHLLFHQDQAVFEFGPNGATGPHGFEVFNGNGVFEGALYYRTGSNEWVFEDASGNDILSVDSVSGLVRVNAGLDNGMGTGTHAVVNVVHWGTGSASATGIEGTIHTSDA